MNLSTEYETPTVDAMQMDENEEEDDDEEVHIDHVRISLSL